MRHSILQAAVCFLMLAAGFAHAQAAGEPIGFDAVFARYQKGEEVDADLAKVISLTTLPVPQRFNAAYLLAVIMLDRGMPDQAIANLERCDALQGGQAQVSVRRAEALTALKDFKGAQKAIDKAAKSLVGANSEITMRLALAHAELDAAQGNALKAAERLEKMAKTKKGLWEVWFNLARYYETLDRPSDALDAWEKVIGLDPKADPFPGVVALQRWAALSMSSDAGSYGKLALVKKAIERYDQFLSRAKANRVPEKLEAATQQAVGVLKQYVLPQLEKSK